jgi:polysaccharide export outer membrane protein
MTRTQIQNLLTDKLSKFIAAPDVTVTLLGLQSRKIYFIGQGVKRQGGMVLNGPLTIAQALSDAGGLGEYANGKKVIIQRRDENGNVKIFLFNYKEYLKGKNPKGNILLQPGDTIVVN